MKTPRVSDDREKTFFKSGVLFEAGPVKVTITDSLTKRWVEAVGLHEVVRYMLTALLDPSI